MVIREAYVRNFGGISDRHFYFDDKIEVVSAGNETGKTTLHAFIRAMLFGLERSRGRAAAKDDFARYEPWEQPGIYGGILRFSCGGRNFRLERNFDRYTKRAILFCEDDGEELSVEQGDLSMLLGGLTGPMFDDTVSVGQLKAKPGQELYEALENYTVNYWNTGSAQIDLAAAMRILKERKKEAARAVREADEKAEVRRERLRTEIQCLDADLAELGEEYDDVKERISRYPKEESRRGAEEKYPGRGVVFSGIAGLLTGTAGIFWSSFVHRQTEHIQSSLLLWIAWLAVLIGLILIPVGILRRRTRTDREEGEGRNALLWKEERLRAERREKEIRRDNLKEEWEEWEMSDNQKQLRQRLDALVLAMNTLAESAQEAGKAGGKEMKEKASCILSRITEGKYCGIDLDGQGHLFVWDGSRRIEAERLSRGTIEQLYFAVRLSASDILLEEPIPLIFDDAFAFYDDRRLESTLKWLRGQEKQVIIFTCQKREEEIVRKLRG